MIEDLLKPHISNLNKIRIGPESDSGYVLIEEPFIDSQLFFSFGVGGNIDFEKEVVKRFNMICECYDAEPSYIDFPNLISVEMGKSEEIYEGINYHKMHVTKDNINIILPKDKTFVLKMDIEGSEWDVFNNIDVDICNNMSMLIVELHLNNELYRTRSFDTIANSLSRLNQTHKLIHIHGNNHEGYMPYTKGIPNVVECCYVNKKSNYYKDDTDFSDYPVRGLDFSCKSGFDDLILDFWK